VQGCETARPRRGVDGCPYAAMDGLGGARQNPKPAGRRSGSSSCADRVSMYVLPPARGPGCRADVFWSRDAGGELLAAIMEC